MKICREIKEEWWVEIGWGREMGTGDEKLGTKTNNWEGDEQLGTRTNDECGRKIKMGQKKQYKRMR